MAQQEKMVQANQMLRERDAVIESLRNASAPSQENAMDVDMKETPTGHDTTTNKEQPSVAENPKTETFEKFLELRKRLRRSIFRDDEVNIHIACNFLFDSLCVH